MKIVPNQPFFEAVLDGVERAIHKLLQPFMRIFTCLLILAFSVPGFSQQTIGLFKNDSTSLNGYTLFTPNGSTHSYLIDNCGELIHDWDAGELPGMVGYLQENGDLVRLRKDTAGTFRAGGWGGGIDRFDWNGNRIWHMDLYGQNWQQHHDVEVMPNGNILVIAWELFSLQEAVDAGLDTTQVFINEIWSEMVLEIEPLPDSGGTIVWEWHAWDHVVQDFDSTKANYGVVSQNADKIDINYLFPIPDPDWLHFNSIAYNEELDQIMLSVRTFSELWIIDHSTSTSQAASDQGGRSGKGGGLIYRWGNSAAYKRGNIFNQELYGQHDPIWIPKGYRDEGKILVFNNGFQRPQGNYSTVQIIDPPYLADSSGYELNSPAPYAPAKASWTYPNKADTNFFSFGISGSQRLSNGNTLVTEGFEGRIFELDSKDRIVWEYINPLAKDVPMNQGDTAKFNSVFRAYRYDENFPAFAGRKLDPQGPLEANPLPSTCMIYTDKDTTQQDTTQMGLTTPYLLATETGVKPFPNPFKDQLNLRFADWEGELSINLLNISGQIVQHWDVKTSGNETLPLPVNEVPEGVYLLEVADHNGQVARFRLLRSR
ncbi:aryl-sulfate sulfotransferase [bacterium SCSIO 12741]|nr:aryl-sulfate sulfotransferase [bacterium SCSIO 12741]